MTGCHHADKPVFNLSFLSAPLNGHHIAAVTYSPYWYNKFTPIHTAGKFNTITILLQALSSQIYPKTLPWYLHDHAIYFVKHIKQRTSVNCNFCPFSCDNSPDNYTKTVIKIHTCPTNSSYLKIDLGLILRLTSYNHHGEDSCQSNNHDQENGPNWVLDEVRLQVDDECTEDDDSGSCRWKKTETALTHYCMFQTCSYLL